MLIANRLFAYPILSDETDAYKGSVFEVEYSSKREDIHYIRVDFDIIMDNRQLSDSIKNGDAEYVIHVECSNTAYRKVVKSSEKSISVKLAIDEVQTKVDFVAMIVAKKDIEGFENEDWDEDYDGMRFNVKKGNILAYHNIESLKILKHTKEFKNANSIFSVNCITGREDFAQATVVFNSPKIQIQLPRYQHLIYTRWMKNIKTQKLVNTLLILPILIYVLGQIDNDDAEEEYGEYMWYRSIDKAFVKKGTSIQEELKNRDVLDVAQEIMGSPLFEALDNLQDLLQNNCNADDDTQGDE